MRSSFGFFLRSSTSFAKYWKVSMIACCAAAGARGALGVVLRIVGADRPVRPVEEQLPVRLGDAEQPGDHRDRKRRRDLLDEIDRAAALREHVVDDLLRDPVDVGVDLLERPGREARADDAAVLAVLGRIELDQGRRRPEVAAVVRGDDEARTGEEGIGILSDLHDVGVLRDGPEGRRARPRIGAPDRSRAARATARAGSRAPRCGRDG